MIRFDVLTLFPQLFTSHLLELPFKRALEKKLISVNLHNFREFSTDTHKTVDAKPYGGGVGMVLMLDPIYNCLKALYTKLYADDQKLKAGIIILTPRGQKFNQAQARKFLTFSQITLICGRYEGIDARITKVNKLLAKDISHQPNIPVYQLSLGNFVLSGGELPALAVMEAMVRQLPEVLEKPAAWQNESFLDPAAKVKEHPHFTRPENYRGLKVPKPLLSGHHANIATWRAKNTH